MKKIITLFAVIFAFLCKNEILTLFLLGVGVVTVAVFILRAWASKETAKMPGSFSSDWGRK